MITIPCDLEDEEGRRVFALLFKANAVGYPEAVYPDVYVCYEKGKLPQMRKVAVGTHIYSREP